MWPIIVCLGESQVLSIQVSSPKKVLLTIQDSVGSLLALACNLSKETSTGVIAGAAVGGVTIAAIGVAILIA